MMGKKVHVAAAPAAELSPGSLVSLAAYIQLQARKHFSTPLGRHGVDRAAAHATS